MISEPLFLIGPSQSFLLGCAFQEFKSTRSFAAFAIERFDRWSWAPKIVPHTGTLLDFLCDRLEPFYGAPCEPYSVDLPELLPPDNGQRINLDKATVIYSESIPDVIFNEFSGGVRWGISYNFLGRLGILLRDVVAWRPFDGIKFPRDAGEFVQTRIRLGEALEANDLDAISEMTRAVQKDQLQRVEELLVELVSQNEHVIHFDAGRKFGRALAAYYQHELYTEEFPPQIRGP